MRPLAFLICLFLTSPAQAAQRVAPFQAIVVAAHDGDTVTLVTPDHRRIKTRLAYCDSPELAMPGKWPDQSGGWEAHTAIDNLILGKTVTVQPIGESYHRMVADLHLGAMDVCEEMAREGQAMIDPRYTQTPALYMAQDEAAKARRGLWADPAPEPPWEFRAEHEPTRSTGVLRPPHIHR
jgi:micrococcal nuclease